jgi:chemotaxis protein histidine kinase CheA
VLGDARGDAKSRIQARGAPLAQLAATRSAMKFHDYIINETTLMANRLLARRSKKSLEDLHALHETLAQALQAFETSIGNWSKIDQDEEIPDVAERLTASAAAQADQIAKAIRAEADAALSATRAEAATEVAAARAELHRATSENADLAKSLKAAQAEMKRAQAELQELQARAEESRRELEDRIEESRRDMQARVEESRRELQAELEKTRADADMFRAEADAVRADASSQKHEIDAARTELARLQEAHKVTEAALRDAISAKAQDTRGKAAVETELTAMRGAIARLSAVCAELDACAAVPNAVTTVAAALGADFPRVALFSVRGNRFEGMYQAGFDFETDISKLVVPVTMNPLMAKAVASGRVETAEANGASGAGSAPFGGSPTFTLAMPLAVHGDVLWLVYVDNAGATPDKNAIASAQRTALAELLRRHALPVLERLSLAPKMAAELRAYAKTLMDQIESMYAVDADSGEDSGRVVERLEDNLRCAREMFARRIDGESPAAARLFDERLAATLKENGTSSFGRDLTAILSRGEEAAVRAS